MIVKLRRKECETPKERTQPCLEVGALVRSGVGADAREWCRRCARVVSLVRRCVGAMGRLCASGVAGAQRHRRRCARVVS